MSFENVQSGVSTTIQLIPGYDGDNVSNGDYKVLNVGNEKNVVLRPGTFTQERTEFGGGMEVIWNVAIELFIKYQDDVQVNNAIWDERQKIIDKINEYPKLGGSATLALITGGAEPVPVFGEDGSGPHFMLQEITCAAQEYLVITEAE